MADRDREVYQTRGETLDADAFRDRVRDRLRELVDEGARYTKASKISDGVDAPPQRLSVHIPYLIDEGALTVWRDSNLTMYRITIDEGETEDETMNETKDRTKIGEGRQDD